MDDPKNPPRHALHLHGDEPHLIREVFRTYQVLVLGFAEMTGMTASKFSLMRILGLSETDMGITRLARLLGINAAAVTRQVQELEQQGLILRRTGERDARRSYVTLSPEGRRRFEEIHERTHALEETLAEALGEEELRQAAKTLAKLRDFIEHLK